MKRVYIFVLALLLTGSCWLVAEDEGLQQEVQCLK